MGSGGCTPTPLRLSPAVSASDYEKRVVDFLNLAKSILLDCYDRGARLL
jgi:hypothetical protein